MKVLKSKGFTLAEMLIVMAVVVVLAAAAVPKIGSVIEGANESNDLSALSAAYTEAFTKAAMKVSGGTSPGDITISSCGPFSQTGDWEFITPKVGGLTDSTKIFAPTSTTTSVKFTFTGDTMATLTLTAVAAGG